MQNQQLNYLTEIPNEEKSDFDQFIKDSRKKFISTPKDTVNHILVTHDDLMYELKDKKNASETINVLREKAFTSFLKDEAKMNAYILNRISEQFDAPKCSFDNFVSIFQQSTQELKIKLREFFGDFAGQIYPYIYRLSLSNTQSRRSRAGKVFEGIIYAIYNVLEYPFESQAQVGTKNFKTKKLGKIVDSLLPSLASFEQRRDKVIIGTMKTTLRERWQEVIEEIDRTSLPKIYLLTVDEDISSNKAEQMANHNVILVVYKSVKLGDNLKNKRNVISFEDYLFDEIPEIFNYWMKL